MACFSVTKLGFLTIPELLNDVLAEMTGDVAAGATNSVEYFEEVYNGPGYGSFSTHTIITLKTKFPVDPLANATAVGSTTISNIEPGWRITFNLETDKRLHVHVGTQMQLTDTGNVARLTSRSLTGVIVQKEPAVLPK